MALGQVDLIDRTVVRSGMFIVLVFLMNEPYAYYIFIPLILWIF